MKGENHRQGPAISSPSNPIISENKERINSSDERSSKIRSYDPDNGKNDDNENSLMYHSLYAYTEVMGYPALLRLKVKELFYYGKDGSGIIKRDYILKNIEEELISKGKRLSRPHQSETSSSVISIDDLFKIVKQYDKSFNPKLSSKIINDDGTPRIVYH